VTARACYREDAAVAGGALVKRETEIMGRRPRQLSLQEATTRELVR
jgi:hypothetical protein